MLMGDVLFGHYSVAQYAEFCLRLVLAFIAGGVIGYERSNHFKEAGVRTHIIVCLTAALIMLISKYAFVDIGKTGNMEYFGTKGADTARVAAQAVSGISFLCAGVIIKVGSNIKGLTTAAGIWMTASLGLAIGAGMYIVSGFTLMLILILQYAVTKVRIGSDSYDSYRLKFVVKNDDHFEEVLKEQLKVWGVQVTENSINWKRGDTAEFEIVVRRDKVISYNNVKSFVAANPSVVSFCYNPMHVHLQF